MTQPGNGAVTRTDVGATEWIIDDELLHLREWGSHKIHPLPPNGDELTIGADDGCALRLVDPSRRVSRQHARLYREHARWSLRDLGSRNGTRLDGARRGSFPLAPGVEVGIGRITLIAESRALIALRGFLARLLGWGADRLVAIDQALRAVRTAATRRGALIICGSGDLVPLAHGLHRLTLGWVRPFIVCDPRRRSSAPSVRAAEGHQEGLRAMEVAVGGTLCMRTRRLPRDFQEVAIALRNPISRVQLVLCTDHVAEAKQLLIDPVIIPPLARRRGELPRIVDEYARDAIEELAATATGFTAAERDWVIAHAASSLPEIEKATRRLIAIRQAESISQAAARLGMSHAALSQWIGRRRLP
jgi:pSer/pThr/pTyr-binding forkhead associated (FHA) protein